MYNEDEQHSTTGDIRPDEVQILIDQRMAYLIEKEREEEILNYIRQSCTERMEERQVCEYNGMTMVDITKGVKVGGAIVFFLDVDRMMKF